MLLIFLRDKTTGMRKKRSWKGNNPSKRTLAGWARVLLVRIFLA